MSKGSKREEESKAVGQEAVEASAGNGAESNVRDEKDEIEKEVAAHPYKKFFGKDVFIRLHDVVYPAKVVAVSHLMDMQKRPFPAMGQKHATTRTPVAKLIVFDITGSGRTFPKNSAKRGLEDEEFHEDLEKMEAACGYDEYIAPILNA